MGPVGASAAQPEAATGGRWADHRTVINGMFWRTRCGVPWRDVPPAFGSWKTVYNRHRRWSGDGTLAGVLDALRCGADHAVLRRLALVGCRPQADAFFVVGARF